MGRIGALTRLLSLKLGNLGGPHLDLLLALDQEVADLFAAPLHFAQAFVEDFHLLAALSELEACLGQRLALHVALRADKGDSGLEILDLLAVLLRGGFGLD